ncbi:MAG TPA: DUF433 domain-containing protein [Pseudonocardiaceae bacterium]|nr:DUF433 domain-containing protein [Pseudonocardiaceae bacterium]
MSYPSVVAAALSGASLRQLSYWRSPRSDEGPLLAPSFYRRGARVSYSFQDVVALRTFVYLRAKGIPLQRVRKAVRNLRDLGEVDHLSSYKLVAVGKDVVWRVSDDAAIDLTRSPGNHVIAEMVDILGPFSGLRDRQVVPLRKPKPGLAVDPEIRGGYPVIEGTRVPYDVVAALVQDGLAPEEVVDFYPSVSPEAAVGARDFAVYVSEYRDRVPA